MGSRRRNQDCNPDSPVIRDHFSGSRDRLFLIFGIPGLEKKMANPDGIGIPKFKSRRDRDPEGPIPTGSGSRRSNPDGIGIPKYFSFGIP